MKLLNEVLARMMTWYHAEKGQTLVEYGLIIALVSIVIVAAFATGLSGAFTTLIARIVTAFSS